MFCYYPARSTLTPKHDCVCADTRCGLKIRDRKSIEGVVNAARNDYRYYSYCKTISIFTPTYLSSLNTAGPSGEDLIHKSKSVILALD